MHEEGRVKQRAARWRLLGMALMAPAGLLLAGCQATLFTAINASASDRGIVRSAGITYERAHHLKLDVYAPAQAQGLPVVVFFYGGSWQSGRRQWYRWAGERLARLGAVVVVPDYRKFPRARMPGFMRDASHAVAWASAHAAEYGGDGDRLFLMGHSAGAHIAALLATDDRWLEAVGLRADRLAGFVGLAGPYDFLPLREEVFRDIFGHDHARQLASQPVQFVDGDEPPMLLLQGRADETVAPRNARSLARQMQQAGEPVTLKLYPGIGHVGLLLSLSRPFDHRAPALAAVRHFIREH